MAGIPSPASCASQNRTKRDWSADNRFYAQDRLKVEKIFGQMRAEIEKCGGAEQPLVVAMDDSLLRKTCRRISRCGWFSVASLRRTQPRSVSLPGALTSNRIHCGHCVPKTIAHRSDFDHISVAVGEMAEWFNAHAWKM